MVHGMGGTCEDWQTWLEVLKDKYPDWILWPLQSISRGCRFLGNDLRELSSIAADEIIETIRSNETMDGQTTLHCIGHSMGGLIIRGALPRVLDSCNTLHLGHYISLSSPHLGIQSSWLHPLHSWRNLCWLSRPISNQLVHLAIQDTFGLATPFLLELSQPESDHMTALGKFRHRTCVSLAFGDPLIPAASGLIDPNLLMEAHSSFNESFWQLTFDDSWPSASKTFGQHGKAASGCLKLPALVLGLMQLLMHGLWRFVVAFLGLCGVAMSSRRSPSQLPDSSPSDSSPKVGRSRSKLSWELSQDLKCKYPAEVYDGLLSVPWRRVVANAHHRPIPKNMHVFLIGKKCEQFTRERPVGKLLSGKYGLLSLLRRGDETGSYFKALCTAQKAMLFAVYTRGDFRADSNSRSEYSQAVASVFTALRQAFGEALALTSAASVGALAAWLLFRRSRPSSRALDPGREELISEYFAPGRLILELPLDNGGTLQVTAHEASESQAPPGAPAGSFQEWRCLRFLRSGGLIQSVTKVVVYPNDDPVPRIQGHVVPLAYTKSFATVVLAALSAMGVPVLPRKAMKAKEPLRILCIGLGGGSVPSFYAESLPHCQVDVVELEPAVVHAAKEGMGFREWHNLRVFVEDGVTFAQQKVQARPRGVGVYDAVLVDAYDPDGNVPEALWSRDGGLVEALSDGLLRPCGVVATNFLPHVDLADALAAYSGALSSHGSGRSFSIQVNKPIDPENDLEKLFDVEGTGNRASAQSCS
ncbi:speE [Symbiodinium natans]|uniref:SpeE protein n=1 Tax=Symbiodinium natans TaxID=878477 RepID=A0A812R256_9DINO|nr:speE [Symbiodinium natans]